MLEKNGSGDYMVSIAMLVYNHEKFLRQALDSILSQKCSFKFEIVVGEDCSPDGSRNVIREYEAKYPNIIKPLYYEKNVGSMGNCFHILQACTGKYVAFCEGDDYWIDDRKLEKQIGFLEANPDFVMCFADAEIVDEMGMTDPFKYPKPDTDVIGLKELIYTNHSIIPTATMTFRNILPKEYPPFFWATKSGDIALHLMLIDLGKVKRFDEKMAAYRVHIGGITKSEEHQRTQDKNLFILYTMVNEHYNFKYDAIFRKRLFPMAKAKLIYGARGKKSFARWKHAFENFPDYIKYSDKVNWKEAIYYLGILFFPWALKLKAGKL